MISINLTSRTGRRPISGAQDPRVPDSQIQGQFEPLGSVDIYKVIFCVSLICVAAAV